MSAFAAEEKASWVEALDSVERQQAVHAPAGAVTVPEMYRHVEVSAPLKSTVLRLAQFAPELHTVSVARLPVVVPASARVMLLPAAIVPSPLKQKPPSNCAAVKRLHNVCAAGSPVPEAEAKEKKEEFEGGIEEEMKKKYYVK